MKHARVLGVVGVVAVAVLAATASLARVVPTDASCLARSARLATRGVDVRWSSPGGDEEAACTDRAGNAALTKLEAALASLPADPSAPRVVVRFARAPGGHVREPRFDPRAGELRMDPASQALDDPSIWLHELAHGLARADQPANEDLVANRVRLAAEEGIADYFAASALQLGVVGAVDGREPRDLATTPPLPATAWTAVPFERAPFSPHVFGAALAADLFARHGFDLPLARALLGALRDTRGVRHGSARAFGEALAAATHDRHADVSTVLSQWLPPSLRDESKLP